ncbi:MAG: TolB family protein [Gaiellaceae bacterium]
MLRAVALAVMIPSVAVHASAVRTIAAPAWSPNGKQVAWIENSSRGGRIFLASSSASAGRPVSNPIGALGELKFISNDELLYVANYELFRLSVTAKRARIFGHGLNFSTNRTGTTVAWQVADTCPLCHGPIDVKELDRGQPTQLGGSNVQNASPTLSADGRKIAFSRTFWNPAAGEYSRGGGIWTSSTAGRSLRRISARGSCPAWSPDGLHIAYVDDANLKLIAPDGAGARRLAGDAICDLANPPGWAPNSRDVAFINSQGQLVVVDAARGRVKAVTTAVVGTVNGFAWSPDSKQLLVASIAHATHGRTCSELSVMKSGGAEQVRKRICS